MDRSSTDIVVLSDEEVETTIPERLKFPCRCIRLGSFETYPKAGKSCIPVILNKNGIFFVVPIISPIKDLYFIKLNTSDVVHIDCHFENRWAQCMFVHTTLQSADALRQQLDEFALDPLQFDSEDKNLRVVTFLLQENTPLEIKNLQEYLGHVFPGKDVINEKVTWEQVNDMLTNSTLHQRDEQAENCINVASNISTKPSMLQLSCEYISMGFVKILPTSRSSCVTLRATFDSFSFTVSERRNVSIIVKYVDITNLAFHFEEQLPIICFRTTTECAKSIRFQLYAIQGSTMRYATESELEMQRRIIFSLKDLSEEQKRFLRGVFSSCSIPTKRLQGIKFARDVLEKFSKKPTQKELQNSKKLKQRSSNLDSSLSSDASDICVIGETDIEQGSINSANVTVVDLDVEDAANNEKNASYIMNEVKDNKADVILLETSLIKNKSSNIDVSTNSIEESDAYIDIDDDDDDISVIGTTHTKTVECIVNVLNSNVENIGMDNSAKKTRSHTEKNVIDWKIPTNAKTSVDIVPEAVLENIIKENSKKQYSVSAVKPKTNNNVKNKKNEPDINNSNHITYAKNSLTLNKIVDTNNIANNEDASITSKRNEAELKIALENEAKIPCKVKILKNNVELTKNLGNLINNKIDVVELQEANNGKQNADVFTMECENDDEVDVVNSVPNSHFGADENTISEIDGKTPECPSNIADHVKMRVRVCRGKTTKMSDKNYALKSEGEWDKNFEKSVARFPFLYSDILFQKSVRDPLFSKIVYRARKKIEPSLYFECWKGDYKETDPKDVLNRPTPAPMRNPYSNPGKKRRKSWAIGVAKSRSRKREIKPHDHSLPLVETMNAGYRPPPSTAINGYISPQSTPSNAQKIRKTYSKRKLAPQEVVSTVSVIKPKKLSFTDSPSVNSTKKRKISNDKESASPTSSKNVKFVEKGPSLKIRLKKCKNGFESSIFPSNGAVNKKAKGEEQHANTIVKTNKDMSHRKSPTNKSVTIQQKCDKKAKSPACKQSKPDNSVPKPRKKLKTNHEKTVNTSQHSKANSIEQASGKHQKESASKKQTQKVPSKKNKVPKKKGN